MITIAMLVRVLTVAISAIVLASSPLHAQQPAPATDQQAQQNGQQAGTGDDSTDSTDEPDTEQADSDAPDELPDIDNQPIQPGSGGPGRFIPSEQISQDLGVSFPVDI